MGRAVSHVGAPWKRAQKMVEAGRADAFVTVPTDVRLAYTDSSRNVVFTFEQRAFVKKGGAAEMALMEDPSLASIAKLRVCDILGNGWAIRFYAPTRHRVSRWQASRIMHETDRPATAWTS